MYVPVRDPGDRAVMAPGRDCPENVPDTFDGEAVPATVPLAEPEITDDCAVPDTVPFAEPEMSDCWAVPATVPFAWPSLILESDAVPATVPRAFPKIALELVVPEMVPVAVPVTVESAALPVSWASERVRVFEEKVSDDVNSPLSVYAIEAPGMLEKYFLLIGVFS